MSSIAEQVALNETALASLKSENESLINKNNLANAEIDRLTAHNQCLQSKLEIYISSTAKMQTLIDSAGVLLIEGKKTGNALQSGVPKNLNGNGKSIASLAAVATALEGATGK